MINPTPIFAELAAEHADAIAAMTRPRWTYAEALKAADAAIAERAKKKAPAKKRTPRKAS